MITASVFRWLNTCHRRVWRDIHLERALRDERSIHTAAIMNAGVQHEEKIHQVAAPQSRHVIVRSWAEGVQLTQQDMRKHIPAIMGAFLEIEITNPFLQQPVKLGGRIDRLECQPSGLYAPIEVKMYSRPREEDELQLSFYVWMLCQLQNVQSLPAAFWLGRNEYSTPKYIEPFECNLAEFEKLLFSALEVISGLQPDVKLLPDCHDCHWYSACFPEAVSKKSITLLSKLQATTKEDFAKAGIQTLDQIVAMEPENLRNFRGIKTTAHGIHASARAWVEEKPIWYGQLHPVFRTAPFYFDIETIPFQKPVWSIGWATEGEAVQVVIVDPIRKFKRVQLPNGETITLVPNADAAWRFFAASVIDSNAPIFHWTPFDATNMKNEAPTDVRDALLPRLHDLCKLFDHAVKMPIKGVSLKTVGAHLGFGWRVYDDWWEAYIDYQKWLKGNNVEALASACAYQQDDVSAMMIVRQWLVDNDPDEH